MEHGASAADRQRHDRARRSRSAQVQGAGFAAFVEKVGAAGKGDPGHELAVALEMEPLVRQRSAHAVTVRSSTPGSRWRGQRSCAVAQPRRRCEHACGRRSRRSRRSRRHGRSGSSSPPESVRATATRWGSGRDPRSRPPRPQPAPGGLLEAGRRAGLGGVAFRDLVRRPPVPVECRSFPSGTNSGRPGSRTRKVWHQLTEPVAQIGEPADRVVVVVVGIGLVTRG